MQRLGDERGAVGVTVALLMVVVLGFAAISVDVAAIYTQKLQLQTGADAAALAIAQDCARDQCGNTATTAQDMATANKNPVDAATATVTSLTSSRVTVRNAGTRDYWFAPVLGHESGTITTQSTASWGAPIGGTAMLPLIFSLCEFNAQTGGPSSTTERTIILPKESGTGCTPNSGNFVPGGFGWINPIAGSCAALSSIADTVGSDTGNSVPSSCSTSDFVKLHHQAVLLPIFIEAGGTGNNAWYRVHGYAAFRITGYHFGGQYSWNQPCSGSERCIRGYFTRFATVSDTFDVGSGAPDLGASLISLTA
jgi:hypothetical protein